MSEKHTPGPWTASEQFNRGGTSPGWIVEHSNGRIGWSHYATAKPNEGESEPYPISGANARLIAAAPELYAACALMLRYCTNRDGSIASLEDAMMTFLEDGSTFDEIVDKVRAAIAKAEPVR